LVVRRLKRPLCQVGGVVSVSSRRPVRVEYVTWLRRLLKGFDRRRVMSDDNRTLSIEGAVMTNMRERGTQRQYLATAISAVCLSNDVLKRLSWTEHASEGGTGSPP
jgi:hypothetical protein